jgi:gamma-glutamylaminecyclotransferase
MRRSGTPAALIDEVARFQAGELEAHTLVFVYGTLLFGESNHGHLVGARLIGEAKTQPAFQLHDLGPYPGLVAGGEHAIIGELYAVDEATLAALDRLEGTPDFYQRVRIVLADGTSAETYLLTSEQVAGHPVIASGSWRARRNEAAR